DAALARAGHPQLPGARDRGARADHALLPRMDRPQRLGPGHHVDRALRLDDRDARVPDQQAAAQGPHRAAGSARHPARRARRRDHRSALPAGEPGDRTGPDRGASTGAGRDRRAGRRRDRAAGHGGRHAPHADRGAGHLRGQRHVRHPAVDARRLHAASHRPLRRRRRQRRRPGPAPGSRAAPVLRAARRGRRRLPRLRRAAAPPRGTARRQRRARPRRRREPEHAAAALGGLPARRDVGAGRGPRRRHRRLQLRQRHHRAAAADGQRAGDRRRARSSALLAALPRGARLRRARVRLAAAHQADLLRRRRRGRRRLACGDRAAGDDRPQRRYRVAVVSRALRPGTAPAGPRGDARGSRVAERGVAALDAARHVHRQRPAGPPLHVRPGLRRDPARSVDQAGRRQLAPVRRDPRQGRDAADRRLPARRRSARQRRRQHDQRAAHGDQGRRVGDQPAGRARRRRPGDDREGAGPGGPRAALDVPRRDDRGLHVLRRGEQARGARDLRRARRRDRRAHPARAQRGGAAAGTRGSRPSRGAARRGPCRPRRAPPARHRRARPACRGGLGERRRRRAGRLHGRRRERAARRRDGAVRLSRPMARRLPSRPRRLAVRPRADGGRAVRARAGDRGRRGGGQTAHVPLRSRRAAARADADRAAARAGARHDDRVRPTHDPRAGKRM
ncbi:MAG: FIG01122338: hypothetical protein, partial [uncultured Solirubrobacteraceae bacterium]